MLLGLLVPVRNIDAREEMTNTSERKIQKAEIFAKRYHDTMKKALLVDSVESLENGDTIQFDYDENGNRIKEYSNTASVTYEYDENNRLISENKDGVIVSFQYEKEYSTDCTSILYDNGSYTLVYDESGSVIGMKNEENDLIAKYTYNSDNSCKVYGKNKNGKWVDKTKDKTFIGNRNPFRMNGNYYDSLSGYYMIGGCCYNKQKDEYFMDRSIFQESEYPIASLMAVSAATINQEAQQLLASSSYGKQISYSSKWYSSLSDKELLARLIYGECMKVSDEPAVAWELVNRKAANWSTFYGKGKTNTLRNIVTKASQYAAITAGENETRSSRLPNVSSERWIQATWYACALYNAPSRSALSSLVYKPDGINKQCYHVAMSLCGKFTGTSSSTLKYNGSSIKDVIITGFDGKITSASSLAGYYEDYSSYNIFFTYTNEYGKNYSFS